LKILLISSSPRKERSQTFLLATEVLKGCADAQTETIHLCDFKIEFCRHCEVCHKKILACPIKDDVQMILGKMLDSDGILLASPNYINQVTAAMKALFDRSAHFIHCKRLLGKYVAGIVCSGSGQDKDVLQYIMYYANTCGAQYVGGVSSAAPVGKEKLEEAFRLGKKFVSTIKAKTQFDKQTKIIEKGKKHFERIIKVRKNDWTEEYQYWEKAGWI
jgi:multimeric flavodoxin WrbA